MVPKMFEPLRFDCMFSLNAPFSYEFPHHIFFVEKEEKYEQVWLKKELYLEL